ncbi:MAG: DUF6288 domain-containing protein [Planctomycetota bacterium]
MTLQRLVFLAAAPVFFLGLLSFSTHASEIKERSTYPAFQAGVTGAWVSIQPGHRMRVEKIDAGSPAEGRLKVGDLIRAANGNAIAGEDPREPLGKALTEAEARSGVLRLSITRDGKRGDVAVRIPELGAYSKAWPRDCAKSDRIIEAHARWLATRQRDDGYFDNRGALWDTMGVLFLLSTGDDTHDGAVERYAHRLAADVERNPSGSAWHLGYHLIFLCEYYLKTGDASVIPAIEAACKKAADSQVAGAWGHYTHRNLSVGYVQSGLMNSAGVTLFLGITLARECGVTVHEEAFQRALTFFYRMVGHGSICYGDHRAEIYPDTNGRNAAIAIALGLLDQQPYQAASEHLALMVADSYKSFEAGHTGGGFNVLWRGIALMHLPDTEMARKHQREHMEQLAWYYDLTRRFDGGMSMLPSPPGEKRYTSEPWGRGLGLTYTAPMRTLRITGGPPTRHSKPTPGVESLPWGTERDTAFFSSEHAPGYGPDKAPAHEVQSAVESKEALPVAELSRYMRHFNPYIRTRAAWKLGTMRTDEAYNAIEAALQHDDPRVRRAGCDAFSGYHHWSRGRTSAGVPRGLVSERFIPHIEAILDDAESAWWEVDGALWALAAGLPEDIRRNREHLDRYGEHDEWYLRESAYWAFMGLGKDITGEEFLDLARRYNRSAHVLERSTMYGGVNYLLRRERVELEPGVIAEYVDLIADQLYSAAVAYGYDEFAARNEAAHRTMMVLSRFQNPPYKLIAKNLATYMDGWEPGNQHGDWLVTGNKWQPGLAKIATQLGKDGGPIIEQFKAALEQDYWDPRSKTYEPVQKAMRDAIAAHEKTDARP